jgi:hypothetical protein
MTSLSREDVEMVKDLGDSYLDIQKTRVAMELRLFQLENRHLVKLDLCTKEETELKKGKKKVGWRYTRANQPIEDELRPLRKLIRIHDSMEEREAPAEQWLEWMEKVPEEYQRKDIGKTTEFIEAIIEVLEKKLKTTREKIKLALQELSDRSETFKRFKLRFDDLEKVEQNILLDAEDIFGSTELWKWCKNVRGLGPVAALTFLSSIDVFVSPDIGHVWSNFGLIPGKTLKRGESTNFNPHIRSRLLGVVCGNILKSGDPYYVGIYEIKKSYHQIRPDLLAKKDEEKAWNMHMHRMTFRVLGKLLVSHAYQLIRYDLGLGSTDILHRNPVPIKSVLAEDNDRVLITYQKNHTMMLDKLRPLWKNYIDGPVDRESRDRNLTAYYEELKHPTITFQYPTAEIKEGEEIANTE